MVKAYCMHTRALTRRSREADRVRSGAAGGKNSGSAASEIRQAAFNGMDYALYSEFESRGAKLYRASPASERPDPFLPPAGRQVAADYEV